MFDSVARIFGAFKNTVTTLKDYYTTLETNPTLPFTPANCRFPYPNAFKHLETGVSTLFSLEAQPLGDKLLYTGSTNAGIDIIVKFTRRYGTQLHLHCSSLGCAPPLLGREELDGGWLMIIMRHMIDYHPFSTLDKRSLSSRLRPILSDLVHSFHQQNLVHGDLRDTNVLVREDGEQLEVKLVDFDWGGVAGEVRYPSAINCIDIWRPLGVTDGMPITKAHDTEMLEFMFDSLRWL